MRKTPENLLATEMARSSIRVWEVRRNGPLGILTVRVEGDRATAQRVAHEFQGSYGWRVDVVG